MFPKFQFSIIILRKRVIHMGKRIDNFGRAGSVLAILLPVLVLAATLGFSGEREAAPQGIIVKPPETSPLEVEVWTTKDRYSPGQEIKIHFRINKKAYLYIYNIDSQGRVNLLFPNKYDRANHLEPGEGELPGKGYSFLAGEEEGDEFLQAIVSTRPLEMFTSIEEERFQKNPFPQLSREPEAFARTGKQNIRAEVSGESWATDWTSVRVTEKISELTINSNPPGARIYVDGNPVGQTPATVEVEPGRREIKLKLPSYELWEDSFSLEPYQTRNIGAKLEPETIAWLKVSSSPSGARVYVDDRLRGITPLTTSTTGGDRGIRVEKEGYQTWEETITVDPPLPERLDVILDEVRYYGLYLDSDPPGAKIFVDGNLRGTTPEELTFPSDRARITLEKGGYERWQDTLLLKPNRTRRVRPELKSREEEMTVSSGKLPLGLNATVGGLMDKSFSFGGEIVINDVILGGSARDTGSGELEDDLHWVSEPPSGGEIFNYGPEWEGFMGYRFALNFGLQLRLGAGLAIQPRAHRAPLEETSEQNSLPLLIDIERDAYLGLSAHPTVQAGIGISRDFPDISLIYHNRRGLLLEVGVNF